MEKLQYLLKDIANNMDGHTFADSELRYVSTLLKPHKFYKHPSMIVTQRISQRDKAWRNIQGVPQLSSHSFCLFSRLPMIIQRFILPFFNSPGDGGSKTHLTFLPISKIDQVTEQNVEQP